LLSRYLVSTEPSPALVERYLAACAARLPPESEEDALVAAVHAWPRLLGLLDAGAALLDPQGVLRSKLLVMAAVLEASPHCPDAFLPVGAAGFGWVPSALAAGLRGVGKALLGGVLVAALRAARRD
jgi:hypothetical protein